MNGPQDTDRSILARIGEMVAVERRLRSRLEEADPAEATRDRQHLRDLETELDRCWDLLRRRRASEEFGENPDDAEPRPSSEVEGYVEGDVD